MRIRSLLTLAVVVLCSLMLVPAFAQDGQGQGQAQGQGQGQGRGGGGGGRGNFDPAQMREMMLNRTKEQLGATDDEMSVLTPKLEKVFNAQRDAMAGRFGGLGGGRRGGGGGGGGSDQPQTTLGKAQQELRTTLEDKSAAAEQIAAKLAAVREARAKAQDELKSAQKELKDVLTQRQEAVLVSMGMLD